MRDLFAVRGIESIADLRRIVQHSFKRQRTLKGLPFDVLEDEVIRPDVVQRANVRMIESGNGARFPLEALRELLLGYLMATIRSRRVSRAFHTSPMPPSPIDERTS